MQWTDTHWIVKDVILFILTVAVILLITMPSMYYLVRWVQWWFPA